MSSFIGTVIRGPVYLLLPLRWFLCRIWRLTKAFSLRSLLWIKSWLHTFSSLSSFSSFLHYFPPSSFSVIHISISSDIHSVHFYPSSDSLQWSLSFSCFPVILWCLFVLLSTRLAPTPTWAPDGIATPGKIAYYRVHPNWSEVDKWHDGKFPLVCLGTFLVSCLADETSKIYREFSFIVGQLVNGLQRLSCYIIYQLIFSLLTSFCNYCFLGSCGFDLSDVCSSHLKLGPSSC